ncbi:MAG: hypothetical protein PHE46_07535 [Bacteroidales bacterium]|nr:hypothetical protein [Bacteroidales bacterium]
MASWGALASIRDNKGSGVVPEGISWSDPMVPGSGMFRVTVLTMVLVSIQVPLSVAGKMTRGLYSPASSQLASRMEKEGLVAPGMSYQIPGPSC